MDSGANIQGSDFFRPPAVAGKCHASDITQITQITYYYKEQGYDSQQVPLVHGFRQGCVDEKSLPPLLPVGGATGGRDKKWLVHKCRGGVNK